MTSMDARPEAFRTLDAMIGSTYKDNALGGDIEITGPLEAAQVVLKRWHRHRQRIGAMQMDRRKILARIDTAETDDAAFKAYNERIDLA